MKQNRSLKKALALMLALLMLALCGCKTAPDSSGTGEVIDTETGEAKEIPWLTMVVDSPMIPSLYISQFLESVPGYGTEFQVEFETINQLNMVTEGNDGKPAEDPEIRLRRMRTEIMAGKGPDIFLCDCASAAFRETEEGEPYCEPTFNYPEQAMRNNVFLPLDDYIAKAEHMEWEKLNPKVMEAGRYEGKQYILPIKYNLNLTCFDPEQVSAELVGEYTALPTMEYALDPAASYTDLLSYFGQPADYDNDVPSFTEEELLELALSGLETAQRSREGYFDELLNDPGYAFGAGPMGRYLFWNASPGSQPAYTMAPASTRDGGVTAGVTCYAAVNVNTKHPGEAFRVLDRLLSEDVQQNYYITSSVSGIPAYGELGSADMKIGPEGSVWWLNEANYESFCSIRDQISTVRFYSLMDREAMASVSRAYLAEEATQDSVRAAAHKAYMTMQMMLAES